MVDEDWDNFPFGFLGANSFTIVRNAGSARIKGAEQQSNGHQWLD